MDEGLEEEIEDSPPYSLRKTSPYLKDKLEQLRKLDEAMEVNTMKTHQCGRQPG